VVGERYRSSRGSPRERRLASTFCASAALHLLLERDEPRWLQFATTSTFSRGVSSNTGMVFRVPWRRALPSSARALPELRHPEAMGEE